MAITQWSETVVLAELSDDPEFSDDMKALFDLIPGPPPMHVLLNFSNVNYLNSSNIAKLLKLRKVITMTLQRKLKLCGISREVWGVFLVTGLDRIFDVVDDVPTGLAALHLEG